MCMYNIQTAKYAPLAQTYVFVPIAVETMGAVNSDGLEFLGNLGRLITIGVGAGGDRGITPPPLSGMGG